MKAERWQKLDELFHSALELDGDARAAFLAKACDSDAELLRELESMLAHHHEAKSFMESPAYAVEAESIVANDDSPTLIGKTVGRYEIRSQLGAGGMGEVYLAEDTRLHRKVALKILPTELAANKDHMRRFEQEAQAAAALNYPNIAHIYEIGQSEGTSFIAMEYIDGVTLREKIHKERTELRKLLRFLQHAAEGLAKAHTAGIVHRDLKPDNIMITRDGHAKILDFGLAKLIEQQPMPHGEAGEAPTAVLPQHSTPGVIMGTVGYMSPEQAQAKPVDQRSDIFSFGCILYEVVTGRRAFAGDSAVDTLHKIIRDPAPAITDSNPSASPELQRIIRKCLAKEPEKRYQTIRDTANDLEELIEEMKGVSDIERSVAPPASTTTSSPPGSRDDNIGAESTASVSQRPASSAEYVVSGFRQHKLVVVIVLLVLLSGVAAFSFYLRARSAPVAIQSIAVMPFQNKSSDADTEYLSDGLAESLIYRLSQLPNLKVSPTSSVFRYKGRETDTRKIADELGVDSLLTGRITQRGDNLTISVELVDVRNNKSLWGEQYERKMSELLATQREITAEITNKLQLKLSGEDKKVITKHYTNNDEAYQLYLKGRFHYAKRTTLDMLKGIEFFRQAIKLDPNFALAYVGVADSYKSLAKTSSLSPIEAIAQARTYAKQALAIDPELSEAHASLADSLTIYDWNWPEAEREYKRAIDLDPNVSYTHASFGFGYLVCVGRADEAVAEAQRAVELEPLSLVNNAILTATYVFARQYDKAVEQGKKTTDLDPNFKTGESWLRIAYVANGMNEEAIALKKDPDSTVAAVAYARTGRRHEAEQIIKRIRETAGTKYYPSYNFAIVYAALGDKDKAFAELEKSFANHDWDLQRVKLAPFMDPLRGDPRFKDLLRRMGLPE